MKSSKVDPRKKTSDGLGAKELLRDIETISDALYLNKNYSKNTIPNLSQRSKSVGKSYLDELASKPNGTNDKSSQKEKKSIWNWKGLMGFTRNRRFNCCFSLQVHSIEGLPSCFEDLNFCVHFKRRDEGMVTNPARVVDGVAEFRDRLNLTCSVYGSRSGPHHSAKYEAKHFMLYAALSNDPELDLGKHRVDLTRFLPLTLEELEDEKSSSNWSTSFKLSGMGKGAIMNVTFGYSVVGSNSTPPIPKTKRDISNVSNLKRNNSIMDKSEIKGIIQRTGSLPSRSSTSSRSVEDLKDLHEVLPTSSSGLEIAKSVEILYSKLDEEKLNLKADSGRELDSTSCSLEPELQSDTVSSNGNDMESRKHELEKIEPFSATQEEEGAKKEVKLEEVSLNSKLENSNFNSVSCNGNEMESGKHELEKIGPFWAKQEEEGAVKEVNLEEVSVNSKMENPNASKDDDSVEDTKLQPKIDEFGSTSDNTESLMKDLELALHSVSAAEIAVDSPGGEKLEENNFAEMKSDYKMKRKAKSLCLDDITNSVADDFLNMLGIEHSPFGLSSESEPESPRERLLRQFEKDTLAAGCSLFNFNMEEEFDNDEFDLFQAELDLATESEMRKPCASMLEDLETEALMHEWGLNEKTFIESPPGSGRSVGFGSTIQISPEEAQLPPLGEGAGSFVQTKNGGFLRSMNPEHFRNAKNGGCLVMQVSSPVVVPAEMGSGIMEILERLASVGIEKLSMQANKLMPLDDVTGKTMQQVAWEAVPGSEESERQVKLKNDYEFETNVPSGQKSRKSSKFGKEIESEYVSLEDLAPLAMDKIEALSIEGLRIQSGMSDEEAPSNITPQNFGEISALKSLEGAGGLQLLDIKDSDDDDVDNLMSLSLTLDEWLRIDSGEIDDDDGISERTSKILAAHHASDSIRERSKADKKRGKGSRKCGLLGNNFTVALLVQLRDPIRNYEPVGTPMLALIQVERVFVPPKPKFYITVSDLRNQTEEEETKSKPPKEEPKEEEEVTQFKITEVHVAGLKTESGKKNIWGSSAKQQSGSRWLVANGMGKGKKLPFAAKAVAKSALPATVTAQPGDTLWSISARVLGNRGKWKDLAKLNPHIRNPNVILPNETIKLR